jgi:hypothetical protein
MSIIIYVVAYDNYDNFQILNFKIPQNFSSIFKILFNDQIDLCVR